MSTSQSFFQKEDVDDVVVTQSTDVTQYLQNTTIEDLSILISSLEVASSSIVKKEEDNNIINNKNILSKLVETTVTLHVWNQFTNYLHRKYPNGTELVFQAEIDAAFLSVVNKFNSQTQTTTSSTSLLFDGTTPRKDCLEKLSDIAISFSEQDDFPSIKIKIIKEVIKSNVGKDPRTQKKYFECIKQYSTPIKDEYWNLKSYDVRRFYDLIPREILNQERK